MYHVHDSICPVIISNEHTVDSYITIAVKHQFLSFLIRHTASILRYLE